MTHCIEHVKQSEVNMLRDLCMTTFRTTFEEGEYSDEDFKHYFNEAYAVEQLKKELLNKNSFTYFYKENNKVIGYFKLNINEAQTEAMGNDYLELQRIYFLPQAQGSGKGKSVFDFAVAKAKDLNKSKLWLGVWEHNTQAYRFYQKQGLAVTGEHQFYTGSIIDTDLIMEKYL
ncbi:MULTISPECIES: GNAT family N-acetyltransferase [Staphylococcus]|uniref:Acetyltransferase n=1 Tax=Staphylococcus equorum TaxID=246432 RepID=A0AAP7IE40_9STAP|nr:GNAT family N-acetyltransferase [Staphylococcus equorum]MDG0824256.1 GNAT family N-acetyltransferase [Staphylococcus equorum]MDK9845643.1 GNAT family N-acetyltransferase [Staphylococcus equorum]MDK9848410.1 GNAT family N-acetyltransferase [Staphylococcus equorum]MDK9855363.1 GNAT family N-acetyltransferase [Staphylococcus equorum]MDK9863274.1 GNAT family N-acetyltransferase [Staphylococcus equorum]